MVGEAEPIGCRHRELCGVHGRYSSAHWIKSAKCFPSLTFPSAESWLHCWRGMILGDFADEEIHQRMESIVDDVCAEAKESGWSVEREKIHDIFWGLSFLEDKSSDVISCLEGLLTPRQCHAPTPSRPSRGRASKVVSTKVESKMDRKVIASKLWTMMIDRYREAILEFEDVTDFEKRKPILLLLDKSLQQFPWECLPVLRESSQPVCRIPSLSFAISLLNREISRPVVTDGVDSQRVYYIINPDGNDERKGFRSQQRERWRVTLKTTGRKGWRGVQDSLPNVSNFQTAAQV